MQVLVLLLFALRAVVPAGTPLRARECAVAIELHVEAPLQWGAPEWRRVAREVDRIWAPYGLDICWVGLTRPCSGRRVRLQVVVTNDLPSDGASVATTVGRILFDANGPTSDIALSVKAARELVALATLDENMGAWPPGAWDSLLPRVLARALAHEIGHYELRSRRHATSGLMAPSLQAYAVTFGPASRFRLTPEQASAWHGLCLLDPSRGSEAGEAGGN